MSQELPAVNADLRTPLDIPLRLSGTFGELRTDHFHSGIDIKTNGKEGEKIYTIESGYVSRIKVSPEGFGKALYITHPNGLVSVYAHLKDFTGNVSKYVKGKQYEYKKFSVNLFPDKAEFPVKKGELIGYSGNTGGSKGPHLHFEIRNAETEKPLNPLQYGFEVKDYIRPKIESLKVYPLNIYSEVDHDCQPRKYKTAGWGEKYRIKNYDTIYVSGDIYFGILTYDLLNKTNNKNGVYSVEMYLDSALVFSSEMNEFAFAETRYINSLIDYEEFIENKKRYVRTLVDPNNKLTIYKKVKNNGIISFSDTGNHHLTIIVKDFYGNTSKLSAVLKSYRMDLSIIPAEVSEGIYFDCMQANSFENGNFILNAPAGSFYNSFRFIYDELPKTDSINSKIHIIHKETIPVHSWIEIAIKADSVKENYQDKLLIVKINEEDDHNAEGGKYENGFVKTLIRSFGKYAVMMDTVPPEIEPLNIHDNKNISGDKLLKIKVSDNLSGIDKYEACMNEEWILMEYDPKNDMLIYYIDDRIEKGWNNFKLEVSDERNNKAVYKAKLKY